MSNDKANPPAPVRNERRTVVILGASSGIGRATALAFAREGADVVLASRGADALTVVASECRSLGVHALAVPTDATDEASVQALADAASSLHGRIDVWVNIVGVGAVGRFEETPAPVHRKIVETNLIGGINGAHAAMSHFLRRGRGTFIQMISVGGWMPLPYATAYSASKFGLHGFVEALRAEVSGVPGIHVCAVYPTVVDTPGLSHGANYSGRRLHPRGPLLDPTDVGAAIERLARHPRSTLSLGALAWLAKAGHAVAPDLSARMLRWLLGGALSRARPERRTTGNLFEASVGHEVHGGLRWPPRTVSTGVVGAGLIAVAVAGLVWALPRRRRSPRAISHTRGRGTGAE